VCAGRLRVGGQPGHHNPGSHAREPPGTSPSRRDEHPGRGPECTAQIMSATESPRRSASARGDPPAGRGGRAAMAAKADRVALEALRRSLVPAALPLVTGAEMAARYVPGRGVTGGDWYDVFTLPSGELSVVIGDVAGSGLPTASAQAVRLPRPVPSFTRSRGNATCLAGRKLPRGTRQEARRGLARDCLILRLSQPCPRADQICHQPAAVQG
jgi:hypothetical protein